VFDALPLTALRAYQQDGVAWLVRNLRVTRALLLCDDPGLGKSVQALHAADLMDVKRVLVVSPAGARRVWLHEITKWFPKWLPRVVIVEPGKQVRAVELEADDVIVLVSYDALSQRANTVSATLKRLAWDVLVIDEAHYLKSKSNRTAALYGSRGTDQGIQASAERVILLTGTPTPNHAGELYQHIRAFWPGVLRTLEYADRDMPEDSFIERVCVWRDDPRYGRQITGSRNVDWLRNRMAPYVLHRSKARVLTELPPVTEQDVSLAVSPNTVQAQLPQELRVLHRDLYRTTEQRLLKAIGQLNSEDRPLATLRRLLGETKVNGVCEWVQERLNCGVRKLIVFGWHTRALEHITDRLAEHGAVLVNGDTPPERRAQYVELFQDPRSACRVFVGQIRAAGTAITLTAASEVVIAEPSWVPSENTQAIDRAHRLGQRDHVIATYLYLPGTLDQRIMAVMRRKARELRDLLPVTDAEGL